MKVAFIFVLYKTPSKDIERLRNEIKKLKLEDYKVHFIDNTINNRGYAGGINLGIEKALKEDAEVIVVANPDISIKNLSGNELLQASKYFDVWGFAMKQDKKVYYGGEIDKWRMSGGLIAKKPKKRFVIVDFASGSLICIKREVIEKIGIWDESYFLYYEDVDYCLRAKIAGFKVGIDSYLKYTHFEVSKENPHKDYFLNKNRLKFLMKHGSLRQKLYELIRLPKTVYENRKGFSFNFLTLNFSSLINKSLNFILFLFLIKYFSISEYGIYTLVWAHINLLNPISDLGTTSYGIVYLNQKKQKALNNLFSLRFILSLIISFLAVVLAHFFKFNPRVFLYILLLLPVLLSNSFSGSLLILLSLKNKIYLSSIISLGFNFLLILILIPLILFYKNLTFVFIAVFVLYIGNLLLNLFFVNKESKRFRFTFDKSIWEKITKKSFVFVLISFFAGLYFKADVFLLNYLKSSAEVGVYSAGYKFFEALLFIPASYNIVVTPILSKLIMIKKSELIYRVKRDFLFFAVAGLGFSALLAYLSTFLFSFFLKGSYKESISVFKIVIFAFPPILISSIFLNALYVLKKASAVVYIFLIQVVFNITLNILFIPKYSYIASSYITVYSEILNMILAVVLFRFFFKSYRKAKNVNLH